MYQHERGSTLVASLLLVSMLGLLAAGALRSASIDTQLTGSLDSAEQAGALADAAITRGLTLARQQPEQLPLTTETELVLNDALDPDIGLVQTRIRYVGRLNYCAGLVPAPAESLHFEITGVGDADNATARRLQGFALCRLNCVAAGCAGTERPLQLTYATQLEP